MAGSVDAAPVPPSGGARPVQRAERIDTLDALRGFALFGIFVVNLSAFTLYDFIAPVQRAALPLAEYDRAARFVIELFFHGKFYALFSLLFGIGFAIQLERAEARGGGDLGRYCRRLAVLLLIGLVHLIVLWPGDILTLYALLGFVLIAFHRCPGWALLAWAAVFAALPIGQAWLQATNGFDPGAPLDSLAREYALRGQLGRSNALRRFAEILSEGREFKVLAMFLVGLWVGRRRILHEPRRHRGLLAWTLALGGTIGLAGSAGMGAMEIGHPMARELGPIARAAIYAAGVYPLALAYAAGMTLLGLRAAGRATCSIFAPAGRMALTNYLVQTLIATHVFYPDGMDYGGTVGPLAWIGFAVAAFACQVVVSAIWLRFFRYGPMEWIWRQLTYLRPLPILR